MNIWIMSLCIAGLTAVIATLAQPTGPNKESNKTYAFKVFIITVISSMLVLWLMGTASAPEIEVGEPDF